MTEDPCAEMQLLIQADADGELGPADAARAAAHVQTCASCARHQAQLAALSRRIASEATYHRAPPALRSRVAALAPAPRRRLRAAAPFGAGLAVAAMLALALLPRGGDTLTGEIEADHVRALQPGHLMDVVSTDQHTVKPWFNGKLDYAPTVIDPAAQGYPLQGGRLDFVAGQPVAVLVYKRRQHIIDVYVWPADRGGAPMQTQRHGFNMVRWQQDGLVFWAISDLDPKELAEFASLLRAQG